MDLSSLLEHGRRLVYDMVADHHPAGHLDLPRRLAFIFRMDRYWLAETSADANEKHDAFRPASRDKSG
jgi:hypothetical protein